MQGHRLTKNSKGEERKIGIEIEYAALSLEQAMESIQDLFGGTVKKKTDIVYEVKDTELGNFKLELDAISLQKIADGIQKIENKEEKSFWDGLGLHIGKTIRDAGSKIAPFEIVAPPVGLSRFSDLEKLREELRKKGALGTKENFYFAFGLHLNPEIASEEVDYILAHLQSFLLLAPWLKHIHQIDFSRRVTNFIDPFPESYSELILDQNYSPNMGQLIEDYYAHNPTRNRALDMLPIFAHIDEKLVKKLYGNEEKINKRPTFHYRLPNCELSNANWSFHTEWERWLYVEDLATDTKTRMDLIAQWQEHSERWFSFESEWVEAMKTAMKKYDER